MAGRDPYKWALRINSLGNVSASSATFGATASSSRAGALAGATFYPSSPQRTILLSRYENTARGRSSIRYRIIGSDLEAKLFGCLEKWCAAGQKLLSQCRFFGFGRGQMPLFDRSKAPDFFRDHRKLDGNMMICRIEVLEHLIEQVLV